MSTTVYLVRHGEAAESWDQALDPGLSERGAQQAREMAARLNGEITPVKLFSSPLNRTRETAFPLADLWQDGAIITPELSEVPSAGLDLGNRRAWLTSVMEGKWSEQSDHLQSWRETILDFTRKQTRDAVFVTHFVVINSIIGAIENNDNVVVFRPDHCSITKIQVSGDSMSIIEKGQEAVTVVK
ncbi:histidine phosphatase family protein [Sneathiella litorea]|uniref:Histidine phosphatase family protein n=1 Tax=Sneathiella litorea TaxID=2606216 RepID=A0A6L8W9X0_9PROT|nr:histidine phosphatase family protein [Sneathiella litorea]